MALQWKAEHDLICPGCGLPRDESMAHEDDAPFYTAEALQCHACRTRELAAADLAGNDNPDPTAGVYFSVSANGHH